MGRARKVVLAYSGGVDTSVCIPYLQQEWGVEESNYARGRFRPGLEPIREKLFNPVQVNPSSGCQ